MIMILLSSAVMGAVLYYCAEVLEPWFAAGTSHVVPFGALAALVGAGGLAYGIMVLITGTLRLGQLSRLAGRA